MAEVIEVAHITVGIFPLRLAWQRARKSSHRPTASITLRARAPQIKDRMGVEQRVDGCLGVPLQSSWRALPFFFSLMR